MINKFEKKIRRNYYKSFDRNKEIIDTLVKMNNLISIKLDEIIEKVNEYEEHIEKLENKINTLEGLQKF